MKSYKIKFNGGNKMNIAIKIKSGTGGYYDYSGCDWLKKEIEDDNFPIPRIGETIEILEDNDKKETNHLGTISKVYHEYLVTDVRYWIGENKQGVSIYVVPIGRSVTK